MPFNDILAIRDPARRAEAVAAALDAGSLSNDQIEILLDDDYDVIRAEALDHALAKRLPISEATAERLANGERDWLVRGRLSFYLALMGFARAEALLRARSFPDRDEYDELWDAASAYSKAENLATLEALLAFTLSRDPAVAGTALDLAIGFVHPSHNGITRAFLSTLARIDGLSLPADRLATELGRTGSRAVSPKAPAVARRRAEGAIEVSAEVDGQMQSLCVVPSQAMRNKDNDPESGR